MATMQIWGSRMPDITTFTCTVGACWARINLKEIHLIPDRCRSFLIAKKIISYYN